MASTWDSKLGIWKDSNVPWSSVSQGIPRPLWIFGYASVCFKPAFPFIEQRDAFVEGFVRRFWQLSTDHRGTPDAPGLVMTLVSNEDVQRLQETHSRRLRQFDTDRRVYGRAYRIADDKVEEVVKYLDWREKGGYSKVVTNINLMTGDNETLTVNGLCYAATTSNPHFRYLSIDECAPIIASSKGPSGQNCDYLYALHDYFENNKLAEDYIRTLTEKVKSIQATKLTSKL